LNAITIFLGALFLLGLVSIASPNAAYSTTATSCDASLDGSQEVPPVDTDGTGSATMEFDPSSNELSWSIEFSGLSGPATAAHFHGPAAAGANAGVQVNIGEVSGLVSPMEGSAVLTSEQASSLLEGQLYINIHTEANPDGEIRGQVSCESPTPAEESETATLVIGDQEFDIQYTISGGTLDELTADPALQTLLITISTTSDGNLTIWLPTEAIDADDEFSVFIDDEFGNVVVDELEPTADARVLQIDFENGAEEIEIVGTSMVGGEEPEPAPQTVSVEIEGQTYDIPYEVTGGTVQQVTADIDSKSLMVTINSTASGILTVWLPTEVIDADDEFTVFVDGEPANFTELDPTADARVLELEFEDGAEEVEIAGTFIVPEFGSLALLVVSAAIIGAIVATRRFHKFGGLQI
jgi:predicted secreted protein with PEFG-CTERM motif